jgi:hypothetical protein
VASNLPGRTPQALSWEHLDYLQRISPRFPPRPASVDWVHRDLRRLSRVFGVGRLDKAPVVRTEQTHRLPTEDLLSGLHGARVPLAFLVQGKPGQVFMHIGTWAHDSVGADVAHETLLSLLSGSYTSVDQKIQLGAAKASVQDWSRAGFVLGIPTAKAPDPVDGSLPMDRLIRALSDTEWCFLVLAEPEPEQGIAALRGNVIFEMRAAEAQLEAKRAPKALVDHYTELLKASLTSLTEGISTGAWRTAAYLLGGRVGTVIDGYPRLASAWRSTFSGTKSLPESVRVWEGPFFDTVAMVDQWGLPSGDVPDGPSDYFRHPYLYQTLLSSAQLAAYVHLPNLETGGFTVDAVPDFDVVPAIANPGPTWNLGVILHQKRETKLAYRVEPAALTKHVFVAGVTGAGKTNTIVGLLRNAWSPAASGGARTPFLVIEPTKTEYRRLLPDPDFRKGNLRIFTLGNERVSPFRLNPFEVLPGTSVGEHMDLLRSVFGASFGMWAPLPQILEQCLHRVYADRGWDLAADANHRDPRDRTSPHVPEAYPTLTELAAQVDGVVQEAGYEEKIRDNIRAALHTRLNALRTGGKGRLLDVRRSWPMDDLLSRPTVLELEGMGDDDDKAFVMGLLLIRLYEYRRMPTTPRQSNNSLEHLLVIEEAHRLLAGSTRPRGEEEGDPRGKAVETFSNLLTEIRSYGQGIVIADQVPVKLAPDVVKNTNLKIVHRIVAEDDRKVLAGAMGMTERQSRTLATLKSGQAVVFSEGDDAPLLVKIEEQPKVTPPTSEQVADYMRPARESAKYASLFAPLSACVGVCAAPGRECEIARDLVESAAFQRLFARVVLSTIEDTDALDRLWPDVEQFVRARRPPWSDEPHLLRCLVVRASHWFADRRGTQAGWKYADTAELTAALRRMLLEKVGGMRSLGDGPVAGTQQLRADFRTKALALHERQFEPFPLCETVCPKGLRGGTGKHCLYRHAVADLVASGQMADDWAWASDQKDNKWGEMLVVLRDAAFNVIETVPDDTPAVQRRPIRAAMGRVGFCFAQQMLARDPTLLARHANEWAHSLIDQARKESSDG